MALFLIVSEIRPLTAWNFPLKTAAKPLQTKTYWQPVPYPMVSF